MRSLLLACCLATGICVAADEGSSGLAGTVRAPAQATPHVSAPSNEKPNEATEIRARIAQLMLVTLQGVLGPNNEDRDLLKRCTPGGVILPLATQSREAAEYVTWLRSLPIEAKAGIPLFIGANPGAPPPGGPLPGERPSGASYALGPSLLSIAACPDFAATEQLGHGMARAMTTVGFNLIVGPDLDLAPTLPEAIGTVHTLGHDAGFAAKAAGALVGAYCDEQMLVMPMGFPGGGSNRTANSPATLLTTHARLKDADLFPFIEAIQRGAQIIHVANTLVPTIDEDSRPASLSSAVLRDLLRTELKFEGVAVSGPMDAPEIQRLFDPAEAAVRALAAGADMLYWRRSGPHVTKAVEAVARAVEDGKLDRAVIDSALTRVTKLKKDAGLLERELPKPHKAAAVAKQPYLKEAYEVERRAVTLVRNCDHVLPLTKGVSTPVGVTGVAGTETLKAALEKPLKQVFEHPIGTARFVGDIETFEIHRIVEGSRNLRTIVCVLTDSRRTQGQVQLVRELKAAGVKVVVVLIGYPANVPLFTAADAIVLAYADEANVAGSIKAVAEALLGDGAVAVLPATRELQTRAGKTEVFDAREVTRTPPGRLPIRVNEEFGPGTMLSYDPAPVIKKAAWDFGDGERSGSLRDEHAYQKPGRYPVTLTVTDKEGGVCSGAFEVVVE